MFFFDVKKNRNKWLYDRLYVGPTQYKWDPHASDGYEHVWAFMSKRFPVKFCPGLFLVLGSMKDLQWTNKIQLAVKKLASLSSFLLFSPPQVPTRISRIQI